MGFARIVVRAPSAFFHFFARGDDDDRHLVALLAQLAQKLEAIAVGQADVEQHRVMLA
jgi:hypothetical protein